MLWKLMTEKGLRKIRARRQEIGGYAYIKDQFHKSISAKDNGLWIMRCQLPVSSELAHLLSQSVRFVASGIPSLARDFGRDSVGQLVASTPTISMTKRISHTLETAKTVTCRLRFRVPAPITMQRPNRRQLACAILQGAEVAYRPAGPIIFTPDRVHVTLNL